MPQSSSYRVKTAVAVTVGGIAATALLAATVLDPSPTQVSAPHSIIDAPEFSGTKQLTDPFYEPTEPPAGMAPGTLIKAEPIPDAPPGIIAKRIMYTSETAGGKTSVVTGMYAVREGPPPGPNGRPLITLAHGTTGIAPGCGISQGPFTPESTGAGTWTMMTSGLVGAGFAVVATDYANLGIPEVPDYLVMNGEGHDVLNAARAAFELDPAGLDRTKVGVMGHSQGGHAALSAAYIAPSYAPDLSIKGTVAVAPAIFPPAPALTKFITSAPDSNADYFLSFIADAMISWEANYPGQIKVSDVFSPKGVQAAEVARSKCLTATSKAFSGPKGQYVNQDIPPRVLKIAQENFPIYEKYATPLLIQQGLEDTTVVPGVNIAAARTMCLQGTDVNLQTYPSDVHSSILYTGAPQALDWLNERFSGVPAESDCRGL